MTVERPSALQPLMRLPEHRRIRLLAVSRSLSELAVDLRVGDGDAPTGAVLAVLTRIAATASALVERFAPDAPEAIHNEAYIRLAAWLYDSDPSGASPGGRSAMRASGAAALLSPYKVRPGGLIQ